MPHFTKLKNRIAIGTVQFGLDYGVANNLGQVTKDEAAKILSIAKTNGIDTLDTAVVYGKSEQVLGEIGIKGWNVVSKIPAIPVDCYDATSWIREQVERSLDRLGVLNIKGLLLHNPDQFMSSQGDETYRCLQDLKSEGLINQLGISIYQPSELDDLFINMDFDVVQAPFSILDHRLESSGWMRKLNVSNVDQHIRSIFLQGLLLMPLHSHPEYFSPWNNLMKKWSNWLTTFDITPVQACIGHVLSYQEINKVIVGVDTSLQLQEILSAVEIDIPSIPDDLKSDDVQLLNPSNWKVK
jgi:aryl-alcohol dehydrogenase-like predicted oxidoreductase